MPILWRGWFAGLLLAAMPTVLIAQAKPVAQSTPPTRASAPAVAGAQLGPATPEIGVEATDYFSFSTFTVSVPLRHDGVVPGSEKVVLDGKELTIGQDFWLNRDSGRIYFNKVPDAGQAVTINYRYDPTLATSKGRTGLMQDLGFGSRLFFSYDGTSTNGIPENSTVGLTSQSAGSNGLSGLALYTNRTKLGVQDGASGNHSLDSLLGSGSDKLIMETLKLGGFKLDYQDVSNGFTDFNSAADSGADAATIQRMIKERGMKRLGLTLDDLKFGQGSISESFRQISDGDASIDWRSLGIKQKDWSVNWSSRSISDRFWRFDDLSDTDKDRLKQEVGLTRQNFDGSLKAGHGAFSFNESDVSQSDGNAIRRQSLDYKGVYTLKLGRESVGAGFTRFQNLTDAENNKYYREAGMDHQWADFAGPIGRNKLAYDKNDIGTLNGMLRMSDFTLQSSTYAFRHHERDVAQSFSAFGNMSDADLNFATDGIGKLFNPGYQDNQNDRMGFQRGAGLNRTGSRLDLTPAKWKASFTTLRMDGITDSALYDAMNISAPHFSASATRVSVDPNFNLGSVMDFEHNLIGNLTGLERTDVAAHYDAPKGRSLDLQLMRAATSTGDAARTAFVLKDPKLEVDLSKRKVDAGFTSVGGMSDPEAGWLSQLLGDTEQEAKLKYQPNGKLHIEAWLASAGGGPNNDLQSAKDVSLNWNPNAKTSLELVRTDHTHDTSLGPILDRQFDHFAFRRDFGKYGKLGFTEERLVVDGSQKTETSSTKEDMTYETTLTKTTGLAMEESRTIYDGGGSETMSSETISQKLTRKSGISYTNATYTREGTGLNSEHRGTLGAWLELSGGVRVEYGGGRDITDNTTDAGTKSTNLNVTQGTIGAMNFGGNYTENRFDGQHTSAQGRVAVSTVKPIRIGHFSDLKFTVGSDTQADWSNYSQDNRHIAFSGKYGSSSFGYDYRSALDPASGDRGIDRTFNFATDPSEASKFRANFSYKFRSLPGDQQAMIRNFTLTARPLPKMEISHQLMTNPELSKPDAILGSITQQARVNKWKLDYKKSENFTVGGSFEESMYQGNQLSRVAGLTVMINQTKGSPISFFIGSEAMDTSNGRRAFGRYMLRYDPKQSDTQRFSFFLGNVAYQHYFGSAPSDDGLTFRMDYAYKF